MALFEQSPGNAPAQQSLPVEQVKQMRAQGMDNNRIINALQADGFSTSQIFDAMSSVDEGKIPSDITTPQTQQNNLNQAFNEDFQQPVSHQMSSELNPSNEELIEAIIDEKWNELVDDINKIIDWKNRADSRLVAIETGLKNLRNEFNNLHQGVLGRVSDYDKNLLNVGAELKAMESMFSKVLPSFMENVQKLDNLANSGKNRKNISNNE